MLHDLANCLWLEEARTLCVTVISQLLPSVQRDYSRKSAAGSLVGLLPGSSRKPGCACCMASTFLDAVPMPAPLPIPDAALGLSQMLQGAERPTPPPPDHAMVCNTSMKNDIAPQPVPQIDPI
jgi:hypothetical protein